MSNEKLYSLLIASGSIPSPCRQCRCWSPIDRHYHKILCTAWEIVLRTWRHFEITMNSCPWGCETEFRTAKNVDTQNWVGLQNTFFWVLTTCVYVFKRMASVGGLCERDLLPPQSETTGLGMFFLRARTCGEASSASSMADEREPEGGCKPRFDRDRWKI